MSYSLVLNSNLLGQRTCLIYFCILCVQLSAWHLMNIHWMNTWVKKGNRIDWFGFSKCSNKYFMAENRDFYHDMSFHHHKILLDMNHNDRNQRYWSTLLLESKAWIHTHQHPPGNFCLKKIQIESSIYLFWKTLYVPSSVHYLISFT